ncbi:hypothetical protein INR49_032267 [Caranx melampygus]|nr:hypothetical protein INR49_032267 [Caranx melampygus]
MLTSPVNRLSRGSAHRLLAPLEADGSKPLTSILSGFCDSLRSRRGHKRASGRGALQQHLQLLQLWVTVQRGERRRKPGQWVSDLKSGQEQFRFGRCHLPGAGRVRSTGPTRCPLLNPSERCPDQPDVAVAARGCDARRKPTLRVNSTGSSFQSSGLDPELGENFILLVKHEILPLHCTYSTHVSTDFS